MMNQAASSSPRLIRVVEVLCLAVLLLAAPACLATDHAVVFVYHRFGEPRYPTTNTPVAAFKEQLDYLASHGFHVWPLPRLVRTLRAGKPVPDKTVALSIDDAFQSVYENAWPLLRAHHFPVTIFVSTQAVNRHYPAYMSWSEMRTMQAQGATFADHTVTHPHPLVRKRGESRAAWKKRMRAEVFDAQKCLQKELGPTTNTHPKLFAYPYGEYSPDLARLVNGLGFVAFAQASGVLGEPLDIRALPRFPIDTDFDALSMFARRAVSLPMPLAKARPWSPVVGNANNPPKLILSLVRPLHGLSCYRSDGSRMAQTLKSPTQVIVKADAPLPHGRSMYTCTAPAPGGNYYWYTHPWFRMPQ